MSGKDELFYMTSFERVGEKYSLVSLRKKLTNFTYKSLESSRLVCNMAD